MAVGGNFRNDYTSDIKLDVKIDEFNGFLRDLKRKLARNATMRQVTDYEASRVMEKAVKETGKADELKIRARVGSMRVVYNVNGKTWALFNKKTGRAQHFRDSDWEAINDKKAKILAFRLKARGLSAQSWYRLAQLIGYDVKAPAYVKNALPSKRRAAAAMAGNVAIQRHESENNYVLEVTNKMPILQFHPPGGYAALFAALAGRIGYFKTNLAKGVFDDAAKTAAKYKGISVTTTAV
jgi:mRNA-degrading endonuclease RelE of RelBE toxin-antitoxin system